MIGVPVEQKLAMACEQRLGRVVDAASTFNLRHVASPAGSFKPRKPLRLVVAMTDGDLWLLSHPVLRSAAPVADNPARSQAVPQTHPRRE